MLVNKSEPISMNLILSNSDKLDNTHLVRVSYLLYVYGHKIRSTIIYQAQLDVVHMILRSRTRGVHPLEKPKNHTHGQALPPPDTHTNRHTHMKTLKEMVEREFGTSVEVIDLGSWGGGEGGVDGKDEKIIEIEWMIASGLTEDELYYLRARVPLSHLAPHKVWTRL